MGTWNGSQTNFSVASGWNGTAPSATEDAVFDGSVSIASCTINTSTLSCLRFRVINGYSGTINFTNSLSVYGNYEVDAASATSWTFNASATTGLYFRANASIDIPTTRVTSNIGIRISTTAPANITLTLVRDTTIANFLPTVNEPNGNYSFIINRTSVGNGDNLFVRGNFTHNVYTGTGFFGGTTTINFTSSTTSTIAIGSQGVRNNMVINGTGTFTGTIGLGTGNITTWTNGNTTGLSVSPLGTSTIISNGTTWNNITFGSPSDRTLTITTDLICGGVLSAATSYGWTIVHTGGSVIRIRGTGANNMNIANATVIVEPTSPCTVSLSNQSNNMNLTFNPFPGGQITWQGGTFQGASNFFTYLTSNNGPTPVATAGLGLSGTSGALTINTSPSPSNYIVFPSYIGSSGALTIALLSDLHINGTVSFSLANHTINGAGLSLICGGCSSAAGYSTGGTANIQLSYTGTWNTGISIGNDLIISPFAGQTVTILALTKSVTNKSITYTPNAGTLNSSASALTIASGINVPMSTSNMTWGSVTVGAGSTLTLNQTLNVSGTLLCSGSATFTGTRGWTTNGFTCTTASAVITLQNADATYGSPLAAYNVTGPLILQGTSTTTRVTLQASGRVDFTGSITGSTMTIVSGAIQVGMTVSQRSGLILTGLQPFINDRPVVTTGGGLSWTLNKTLLNPVPVGSLLAAGFKAIFNLTSTGTNVNVGLVTTQDIDSSGGQTILAALSNGDDTATNTALYRTLNWGPLIAPSGSVYYTWVD